MVIALLSTVVSDLAVLSRTETPTDRYLPIQPLQPDVAATAHRRQRPAGDGETGARERAQAAETGRRSPGVDDERRRRRRNRFKCMQSDDDNDDDASIVRR